MVTSWANSPFYENAIRERFWKTHLKHAGVRYRGPNQCRHPFISQLLSLEKWCRCTGSLTTLATRRSS